MKLLPFPPGSSTESGESLGHAVGRVLLENLDRLYSTAHRLTRRADVAEDLVQEPARKALEAAPALYDRRNLRACLFTILVNAARPKGINLDLVLDQSVYVRKAIRNLQLEGAAGALLAGLMILLFIGSFRSTIAILLSLPLSVMAALVGLYFTNNSLNVMTLGRRSSENSGARNGRKATLCACAARWLRCGNRSPGCASVSRWP